MRCQVWSNYRCRTSDYRVGCRYWCNGECFSVWAMLCQQAPQLWRMPSSRCRPNWWLWQCHGVGRLRVCYGTRDSVRTDYRNLLGSRTYVAAWLLSVLGNPEWPSLFFRGRVPQASIVCPIKSKKIDLTWHFWIFTIMQYFPAFRRQGPDPEMRFIVRAWNQTVINICVYEGKTSNKVIHESLESLCNVYKPKGIRKNSQRSGGVTIEILGMLSAAIVIYLNALTKSIFEKKLRFSN